MSRYAADEGRLVYVGNLPEDVRERDLDDIFYKYGRIRHVDIKQPRRPPPFAFVEFDDPRDADDAVRGRDRYDFYGCRLRVELAKGNRSRDNDRRDRDRDERGKKKFTPPNTGYRVIIKGLPPSASWQDLKDFIRDVVTPAYANVDKDRDGETIGVAEFHSFDDMDRVIRKLDDTEFRNPFDKGCVIRIYEDRNKGSGGGGGRSRSKERGGGRSERRGRSASPRGRSRSRSRSRSPRGRSPPRRDSRSRSRSPMDNDRRSRSPAAGAGAPADGGNDADMQQEAAPAQEQQQQQEQQPEDFVPVADE